MHRLNERHKKNFFLFVHPFHYFFLHFLFITFITWIYYPSSSLLSQTQNLAYFTQSYLYQKNSTMKWFLNIQFLTNIIKVYIKFITFQNHLKSIFLWLKLWKCSNYWRTKGSTTKKISKNSPTFFLFSLNLLLANHSSLIQIVQSKWTIKAYWKLWIIK